MDEKELKELGHEMNTQDNLATSFPLYCVYEKDYIYGMDSDYSDEYKWMDSSGDEYNENDIDPKWENIFKVYYIKRDRFLNAHFTGKAARLYIKQNRHNLTEPFVFVTSLYRCHEMIKIQDFLKSNN